LTPKNYLSVNVLSAIFVSKRSITLIIIPFFLFFKMSALFPVSQRNNKKLVFEGFIYSMHRGDEHKTSWRCERFQKGCRGRAVSQGETVIVTQPHNDHLPCTQKCERAVFDGCVRTAARGTHDAPRAVVNECLVGVSDATIAIIPKIVNIEQKVSRARKRQRD
jgi:hypothetical protein